MSQRTFVSTKQLLPGVLAQLAAESGNARSLSSLWEELVGETIAKNAVPRALNDGILTVQVSNRRWALELEACAKTLCERLNQRVGQGRIRGMRFLV